MTSDKPVAPPPPQASEAAASEQPGVLVDSVTAIPTELGGSSTQAVVSAVQRTAQSAGTDKVLQALPHTSVVKPLSDAVAEAMRDAWPIPLDSVSGQAADALPSSVESVGKASPDDALGFPEPLRSGGSLPLPHRDNGDPGGTWIERLRALGGVEPTVSQLRVTASDAASSPVLVAARPLATAGEPSAAVASGADRSGSHAPLENPLPAPRSPVFTASGSGDSSFVPIAALLALLALVAPATSRRFREAPSFSAPTPFVCALERPG